MNKDKLRKALFWHKEDSKIICDLCPHSCVINEGKTGLCKVRKNLSGELYTLNYGEVSALALDPIEKKPLYDFKRKSMILSVGSWGCNFACAFCQNWNISQERPLVKSISPQQLVDLALQTKTDGNIGIAYTYAEPIVSYEYVYDTAKLCQKAGLDNILVSNGFINKEPLLALAPFIAAANIDLKSFNDYFYKKICFGGLEPVLETIKILKDFCHLEISYLVIPELNDSDDEMEQASFWLASLEGDISLHINRYVPQYKITIPATPAETMFRLKNIAEKYIDKVYIGNM